MGKKDCMTHLGIKYDSKHDHDGRLRALIRMAINGCESRSSSTLSSDGLLSRHIDIAMPNREAAWTKRDQVRKLAKGMGVQDLISIEVWE